MDIFNNKNIKIAVNRFIKKGGMHSFSFAYDFEVNVLRIILYIFGEHDFLQAYATKNDIALRTLLTKYGSNEQDLNAFSTQLDAYFEWTKQRKGKTNAIAEVQKVLINMIVKKNDVIKLTQEELAFYESYLYIDANPKITFKAFSLLYSSMSKEISTYWHISKEKMMNVEAKPTTELLPANMYAMHGLSIEEATKMNPQELERINRVISSSAETSSGNVGGGRTVEPPKILTLTPKPIGSGSGFVDALLLSGILSTIVLLGFAIYIYLYMR